MVFKKEETYTRSLRPETIIYALKKCGFIHKNALSLKTISGMPDEVQVTYTFEK